MLSTYDLHVFVTVAEEGSFSRSATRLHLAQPSISDKVARLEKQFDRMTHCRVVVEAPHRHAHKKRPYQIKVEIGMAGRAPIIVHSDHDYNASHEDIGFAVRDAFDAARRQINELTDKRGEPAKHERGRRRPAAPSGM